MPRTRRFQFLRLVHRDGGSVQTADIPKDPDSMSFRFYVILDNKITLWPGDQVTASTHSLPKTPGDQITAPICPLLKIPDGYRNVMFLPTREMIKKGLCVGGEINTDGELRLILKNTMKTRGIQINAKEKIARVEFTPSTKPSLERCKCGRKCPREYGYANDQVKLCYYLRYKKHV